MLKRAGKRTKSRPAPVSRTRSRLPDLPCANCHAAVSREIAIERTTKTKENLRARLCLCMVMNTSLIMNRNFYYFFYILTDLLMLAAESAD